MEKTSTSKTRGEEAPRRPSEPTRQGFQEAHYEICQDDAHEDHCDDGDDPAHGLGERVRGGLEMAKDLWCNWQGR